MRIVAVIAARNEEAYIANALRHLKRNGIFYAVLDNASTDATAAIVGSDEFRSHLVGLTQIPFDGTFDLRLQLTRKMAMIDAIDADWVIHLDADEILHSFRHRESLSDAIARIDAAGFNAIDFNEFVFLPVDCDYDPNRRDHQPMKYFYFFEPTVPHHMRAWKKASGLSMIEHGGHMLTGANIRLAPEKMAMRHYIFRSQSHAFEKYTNRRFPDRELAIGWHSNRVGFRAEDFFFPQREQLCFLQHVDFHMLDRSRPVRRHYWQWSDGCPS